MMTAFARGARAGGRGRRENAAPETSEARHRRWPMNVAASAPKPRADEARSSRLEIGRGVGSVGIEEFAGVKENAANLGQGLTARGGRIGGRFRERGAMLCKRGRQEVEFLGRWWSDEGAAKRGPKPFC